MRAEEDAEMKSAEAAPGGAEEAKAAEVDAAENKPAEKAADKGDAATGGADAAAEGEGARGAADHAEEQPAEGEEAPPEEDPTKEHEIDAAEDTRPKIGTVVVIPAESTTINVLQTGNGKVLSALNDQGCQHLVACARTNVGICKGRYAFEVRVIEVRTSMPEGSRGHKHHAPQPVLRMGVSTGDGSLFLGVGASAGFSADGQEITSDVAEAAARHYIYGDQVYCLLVNMDAGSANSNTISLFMDGARVSKPVPIPEAMKGKAIFPVVNYKCLSLRVNFGPALVCPLPFSCHTLQEAAAEDAEVRVASAVGNTCEVLVPVGLPDEGAFEWLDDFLKDGKRSYTEFSDRALLEWARKSGMQRKGGFTWKNSNDNPGMDLGVKELDESMAPHLLKDLAATLRRDLVVMALRSNLLEEERKKTLEAFGGPDFNRVAMVVIGEPPQKVKDIAHAAILEKKRARARSEVQSKQESERTAKKGKWSEEQKKEDTTDGEKKEDDTANADELEEAIKKAEAAVTLTEQEKGTWFVKGETEDLVTTELSESFVKFSVPKKEEGFDEVKYAWQGQEACVAHMRKWISQQKLTQRVEDLQPGDWFKERQNEWQLLFSEWRSTYSDWQDPNTRRRILERKARRKSEEAAAPKEEAKEKTDNADEKEAAKEEEAGESIEEPAKDETATKEGDADKAKTDVDDKMKSSDGGESKPDSGKEGESKDVGKSIKTNGTGADAKDEEPRPSVEDLEVFSVEDILDAVDGEPLFSNFQYEDWALLSLRFEIHLLVHAFRRDVDDPERPSFHESHLPFYYGKYFRKQLSAKQYNVSGNLELLELIKDSVEADSKHSILEPWLSDDTPFENFVRLTEDARRDRQQRIDCGDESVALKFQRPASNDRGHGGYSSYGGRQQGGYGSGGRQQSYHQRNDHKEHRDNNYRNDYRNDRTSDRNDRGGYNNDRNSSRNAPPPPPQRSSRGAPPSAIPSSRSGGYSGSRSGGNDRGSDRGYDRGGGSGGGSAYERGSSRGGGGYSGDSGSGYGSRGTSNHSDPVGSPYSGGGAKRSSSYGATTSGGAPYKQARSSYGSGGGSSGGARGESYGSGGGYSSSRR